jgi:hypothetical protein
MKERTSYRTSVLTVMMLLFCLGLQARAASEWIGGASGNWNTAGNWDPEGVPGTADAVVIAGSSAVSVTLDVDAEVASLTLTNSHASDKTTLVFDSGSRLLTATTVFIRKGGVVTHTANTATADPWTPDGRVHIVCTNLTLDANGSITVDQLGYEGGAASNNGKGPGGGKYASLRGGGGGYGGAGGRSGGSATSGGITNGNELLPYLYPGSGGGGGDASRTGGDGGGVVRLEVTGTANIDGTISANGQGGQGGESSGGGAGGGIYVTCKTLAGSGTIRANAGGGAGTLGGGGGGGRIAVYFDQTDSPSVAFSASGANGGTSLSVDYAGVPGTLYLSDYAILPGTWSGGLQLLSGRSWSPAGDVTLEGVTGILQPGFTLAAGGDLLLDDAAKLHIMSNVQVRAANVLITNAATAIVEGGSTFTNVGNFTVTGSSTVSFRCNNTTSIPDIGIPGGIYATTFSLSANSTLDADGRGWSGGGQAHNGYGPGGGTYSSRGGGGGYGGPGGKGATAGSTGGPVYDEAYTNAPYRPGSGGAGGDTSTRVGGAGGGYIRLDIDGTAEIAGTISANGANDTTGFAGGGSGGGIYIACRILQGGGTVRANGGSVNGSYGGGGGGGRIAFSAASTNDFGATVTVEPGGITGSNGGEAGTGGTIAWDIVLSSGGTLFMIQ